jgi:tRNA pseudouridine38-40 synthase
MESGSREHGRIALKIHYDGTTFCGWQIQDSGRTVQGEIEQALHVLLKEDIRVTAAGRTDTGVHALGQVIHFDTKTDENLGRICIGLNGILPKDVSVENAYRVSSDFHARYSAVERSYRYLIYNHPSRTPFMINRALWIQQELDLDYMRKVTGHLIGEKDFASFCKKRESHDVNTVRSIKEIDVSKQDGCIRIDFTGNAFLHNMIRIIVGTMVEMFKRNDDPALINEIIEKRDRDFSGITAPPYGLYLVGVVYDPPLRSLESAY